MTQSQEVPSAESKSSSTSRADDLISLAVVLCAVLSAAGILDGLVMAIHRVVARCPDGTYFDQGQDPICYSHPHAGLGIAIIVVSAMLAIVVVLCAAIARSIEIRTMPRSH